MGNRFFVSASALLAGALSFCGLVSPAAAGERSAERGLYSRSADGIAPVAGRLDERGEAPSLGDSAAIKGGEGPAVVRMPEDARSFLPDYMTQASPGTLLPKDDSVVRERADQLAAHFKTFYAEVVYHIDWDDETVNAYAWRSGGERHVALKGGLLRHKALQLEGVALVLAHEIGHHYGGEPTYWNGLSCEGQADYWGAKTGMRAAYEKGYREMMEPAIAQLFAFLSKGVRLTITPTEERLRFSANKGCSHPPADCRRLTYLAGLNDEPKPACAGLDEEPEELSRAASSAPSSR